MSFDFSFLSILSVRTNHRIAVLTCKKAREKLQCLYENIMSHHFRKAVVLKLKQRYKSSTDKFKGPHVAVLQFFRLLVLDVP